MKKKKVFILFVIIVFLLSLLFFIRFFIGGDEDTWICENGKAVKHGNPKYPVNIDCGKNKDELIGGQRDKHGCLTPAGYSWCEIKNKCLRVWEEPCSL